jgi:hypothetical protein
VTNGSRTEVLTVSSKPQVKLLLCSAVDASSSMRGSRSRNATNALVGEGGVVRTLLRPTDLFGCCTFSTEVRKLHHPIELSKIDLGKDAEHIAGNTSRGGGTAIFDAIAQGISDMRKTLQILRKQGGGEKQPLCLEHLVITDGADNKSSISFKEICELVAKPGLPHYRLLIIGAGMTSGARKKKMELLCASAHCTFVPSTADLSQLDSLLGKFREQVRVRMQLLVQDCGESTLTQWEWEGKESSASAAASQLLSQTSLLGQLGALRLTSGGKENLQSVASTSKTGGASASAGISMTGDASSVTSSASDATAADMVKHALVFATRKGAFVTATVIRKSDSRPGKFVLVFEDGKRRYRSLDQIKVARGGVLH